MKKLEYKLGELEEKLSELDFEERCDEFVEVDENLLLVVSYWCVEVPSLAISFRMGVACVYDDEAEMYMPDFDITVLYEGELESDKWIYYEQDGFVVTLANWMNSRLTLSDIESPECYLIVPDEETINN